MIEHQECCCLTRVLTSADQVGLQGEEPDLEHQGARLVSVSQEVEQVSEIQETEPVLVYQGAEHD